MKTTQQEITDRGFKPRKIIFDVIELLIPDRSKKYSEDDKKNKIVLWHVALNDLSDDQIKSGMFKVIRTKNEFMPDSGSFYEICTSSTPAKQYISQSEPDHIPLCNRDLNGENCRTIIEKLGLDKILKDKEFGDFKKNRHIIEASRKPKLRKVKNVNI